ncbi:PREDICTED: serpin B12-like [Nestor notabilis]|uniref:serpin B12-like n=1 Tax=Nestor notabilis TaxID=176057 RepID=UPI0005239F14|nr:PREDICTED: serpin B12-like [Nestor notabilis]
MCSLSAANAKFCLYFFRELSKRKRNENIFFSPLSLSAAFGMVVLGARGNTLEQIEKQYLDSTKKFYRSELEPVNFKYTEEEVTDKINIWVENETKGKIKDLFSAGFIDPSTVLVLVSAIYFKGKWAVEFKKEDTKETYFYLNKNERRTVQMMFQEGYFNMAIIEELKMKVIELLYFDNEMSMFILLPEVVCEDFTGLEQLEHTLTYEKLAEWTNSDRMEQLKVKVYLPQFKMEESYVLNKILQEMGAINVFDWGKADLSGISKKDGLVVSKVIQKSFVEVNEEGTEAAGAMGLVAVPLCRPISYEFKADHPFLFFIRHNSTNTILFFGRYSSP